MKEKITVSGVSSNEFFVRAITLSGQWETFVSSQRFNPTERQRFIAWLGIEGAPRILFADGVKIYGRATGRPRARGQRLNHKIRRPININTTSPVE